jgi:biopolymer transport protein ExbD
MAGRIVDIRRVVANAQTYLANNDTDTAAIQADEDTQHGVGKRIVIVTKIVKTKNAALCSVFFSSELGR